MTQKKNNFWNVSPRQWSVSAVSFSFGVHMHVLHTFVQVCTHTQIIGQWWSSPQFILSEVQLLLTAAQQHSYKTKSTASHGSWVFWQGSFSLGKVKGTQLCYKCLLHFGLGFWALSLMQCTKIFKKDTLWRPGKDCPFIYSVVLIKRTTFYLYPNFFLIHIIWSLNICWHYST